MAEKKTIRYSEPEGYFPKELREKIVRSEKTSKRSVPKSKGGKK